MLQERKINVRRLQAKWLQRLLPIRAQDIVTHRDNRLLREDEHARTKYCDSDHTTVSHSHK